MGTSSSYPGPGGNPPLLPPWAQDPLPIPNPDPVDPQPEPPEPLVNPDGAPPPTQNPPPSNTPPGDAPPTVSWRSPKRAVGKIASGGGSVRDAGRSYVRASGGSRGAASSAVSGRRTTAGLGGFLSRAANGGFADAAASLGITNLVGRSAESILAALVDALAPDGALREEAIARKALIETLDAVFERFEVEANGVGALAAMDAAAVAEIVALSVTTYVNVRFQEELVSRIERGALTERDANGFANQIKEFIDANVRLDLAGADVLGMNWDGAEGKRFVDMQYQRAYRLLGGEA